MSDSKRIAVVTGSNKGIGFEILKKLAAGGFKTILAARNEELGTAAALSAAEHGDVEFRCLDISNPDSIKAFVSNFERDFGRCDVLVNNAGIAFKGADPTPHAQQVRPTFTTNYYGTTNMTVAMLPLLRKGVDARVVTVSHHLKALSDPVKVEYITSEQRTVDDVNAFATEFITDVEAGNHLEKGWPNKNLGMSQLCKVAFLKALARQEKATVGSNVLFVMACPGHCRTDMSSMNGDNSAEEGARTPAWLAMLQLKEGDADAMMGKFYSKQAEVEW